MRKDWPAKLGIKIPEGGPIGYSEFNDLLRRFTKDDPDGNGKTDTYGFGPATGALGNMGPILGAIFGMVGRRKYDGDDYPYVNLQFSRKNPGFKKAFAHTAQLWKDGPINPDWAMVKGEQASVRYKQGALASRAPLPGGRSHTLPTCRSSTTRSWTRCTSGTSVSTPTCRTAASAGSISSSARSSPDLP